MVGTHGYVALMNESHISKPLQVQSEGSVWPVLPNVLIYKV